MARSLIVPVVEVRNVREHPGASLLSIVDVLGYQMVTTLVEDPEGPLERQFLAGVRDAKGRRIPAPDGETGPDFPTETIRYRFKYREGERAVYFPADTVLPDEWIDKFDVRGYVGAGNRIRRARLRGEPSFGLIVEVPAGGQGWEVGDNAAEYYGATQWRPPARVGNDAIGFAEYDNEIDPLFAKYTDLEDGRLVYGRFLPGEEVVVSEKIHGRNCRLGIVEGVMVAGSFSARRAKPEPDGDLEALRNDMFWGPWADPRVVQLLFSLRDGGAKVAILYGEVFGRGVQSLDYGATKGRGFRAFDLYVDGRFLDYDAFAGACDHCGVERVPILHRGPFDLEKVKALAEGPTALGGGHIREGVVVRTAVERRDPALGRVVAKFISTEFDLSKHKDKDSVDA